MEVVDVKSIIVIKRQLYDEYINDKLDAHLVVVVVDRRVVATMMSAISSRLNNNYHS